MTLKGTLVKLHAKQIKSDLRILSDHGCDPELIKCSKFTLLYKIVLSWELENSRIKKLTKHGLNFHSIKQSHYGTGLKYTKLYFIRSNVSKN